MRQTWKDVHGKTSHRGAFVPRLPRATVTANIRISFTLTELMANDCLNMKVTQCLWIPIFASMVLFLSSSNAGAGWPFLFKGPCGLDSVR